MFLWSALRADEFITRQWEEAEVVIFDQTSGDTHLLSEASFMLLTTLSSAATPLSISELTDRLLACFDESTHPIALLEYVSNTVPALWHIGLVRATGKAC